MIYAFDDCVLDTQHITLYQAERAVQLRPKAFQVLLYLLEHRDRVVDKQELSEHVWPDQFISDATLDSTVRAVRRAVGDSRREQRIIQTFYGRGYRFVASVRQQPETAADEGSQSNPPAEENTPRSSVPPAASWQCTACQHVNQIYRSEIARFCVACGVPRPTPCPQCGAETLPQTKFCAACGAALSPVSSPDHVAPGHQPPPSDPPSQPAGSDRSSSLSETEQRQLTVLFCDLVSSTVLSSGLDLEDYLDAVRAYQHAFTEVIHHFDGYIARPLGDGLRVYFGYPRAHDDDAQRAVRAGLGIVETLGKLNIRLMREKRVSLTVHLSIHTGPVIIGDVEHGGRREQVALGDTPTIASRILELTAPNTVVISAATARLVQGYFTCQALGLHTLRGFSASIQLTRVLGTSGAQDHLDTAALIGLTPMVNREAETTLLMERWAQVEDGRGQVIVLRGEAGIGKSRLVRRVQEWLAVASYRRLTCRCSPYHQNSVLYPVIELCHDILHWQQDTTLEEKLRKLETVLDQFAMPREETLPLLAEFLSIPYPSDALMPLPLTPQQKRQRTLEVMSTLVLGLAAQQPVLLIVEDLHWADPSTLEWLTLLVDQGPTTRFCMICTCRPTFRMQWGSRSYLTELTLARLPQRYTEQMIAGVARGKPLPLEVMQHVVDKTGGVPLFVEELTKMVLETELLEEVDGRYELTAPLPAMAIPTTLLDSLMARLDRLDTAKGVAQLGAALGRQFSYRLLSAVAPWDESVLQRELGRLVEAEMVYPFGAPAQTSYVFKHVLIQEAAYQSLMRNTRQHYHQRIAEALAEQFPAMTETQPELLAHHYTEAGQIDLAIPYWERAGQWAIERSANTEALSHLTKGLTLLETLPETLERTQQELTIHLALATPLKILKGHGAPEVERSYNRAYTLCQQVGDSWQSFSVLAGLRGVYTNQMAYRKALTMGEELLDLAQRMQDASLLLNAHGAQGWNLFYLADFVSALAHLEQAIDHYDIRSLPAPVLAQVGDRLVMCLTYAAWVLWFLGYPNQAYRRSQEALALARQRAYAYTLGRALHYAATLHQWRRESPFVQAYTDEMLDLSREHGFERWLAGGTIRQGWVLVEKGEIEAGTAQIRQGLQAWRAAGSELSLPYLLDMLAEAYGKQGKVDQGLRVLDEALSIAHKNEELYYEAELYRQKGELLLQQKGQGQHLGPRAEAYFQQAIVTARSQQAKSLELRAVMSLSRLWQQEGKRAEAHQMLAAIYGWFTEGFETPDLQEAEALLKTLQ